MGAAQAPVAPDPVAGEVAPAHHETSQCPLSKNPTAKTGYRRR